MVRPPAVAGQFYPSDPVAIEDLVRRLMGAASKVELGGVVGLLVPHAGLEYSGQVAASAYRQLVRGSFDTVVLVGAGHRKAVRGAAIFPGDYGTPEGSLVFDADLAGAMTKANPIIVQDPAPHQKEHSLEVQVPFVRGTLGPVKAVGLLMNADDLKICLEVGRALARASAGRRVLFIASADLSHFPPGPIAAAADPTTLEALASMDPELFWRSNRLLKERGLSGLDTACCGNAAVIAVLEACKESGATGLRVLDCRHSGDLTGDPDARRVVGYGAAAFVRTGVPDWRRPYTAEEKAELLAEARGSIKAHLGVPWHDPGPLSCHPRLNLPGAVFVTLTEGAGQLRGCIGDIEPRYTLLESVRGNAVASASRDHRFASITTEDLDRIHIEISVLSPQRVTRWQDVKPGDGVRLERGGRSGVFLPQVWEKLPNTDEFLKILCTQKARLPEDAYKDPGTVLKTFNVEVIE